MILFGMEFLLIGTIMYYICCGDKESYLQEVHIFQVPPSYNSIQQDNGNNNVFEGHTRPSSAPPSYS
jgi:hypothetical protein